MNCSECGGTVAVDRMCCEKCGHDMLAEDIALRPVNHLSVEMQPARPALVAAGLAGLTEQMRGHRARFSWARRSSPAFSIACSECGGAVPVDQLRCQACGHDMVPQDIAVTPRQPAEARLLDSWRSAFTAKRPPAVHPQVAIRAAEEAARMVALTESMRRNRWRVVFVPIGFAAWAFLYWLIRG